jgi:chloramphenicol 3-O phosphotransferase
MSTGTIIFLNGTSSSGKTTLALALQEILPEPYLHIALDQFRDGMPAKYRGLNSPEGTPGAMGLNVVPVMNDAGAYTDIQFGSMGCRMLKGMRRAIACMARTGNNIIIDDIIMNDDFLHDYLDALEELNVVFVGIRCPIEVIMERRRNTWENTPPAGDPIPDPILRWQREVHIPGIYDLEIDTSTMSPEDCADLIQKHLKEGPPSTAFEQLAKIPTNS